MLWIFAALFLFIGAAVAIWPVTVRITFKRQGADDRLVAELRLWPGIGWRLVIATLNLESLFKRPQVGYRAKVETAAGDRLAGEKSRMALPDLLRLIKNIPFLNGVMADLKPSIRYMLRKTTLNRLEWKTALGVGDPYYTGILTGILWSLKGWLCSAAYSLFRTRKSRPALSVVPGYGGKGLAIAFDCIVSTRSGHIIFTGLRIMTTLVFSGKYKRIYRLFNNKFKG